MPARAEELAQSALDWLRDHWNDYRFYVERDVVWTFQNRLQELLEESGSELRVFNDYRVRAGSRRGLSGDIVLVDSAGILQLVIEFKYEPDHSRDDTPKTKFPVVSWGADSVGGDMERVANFVTAGDCACAWSVFIDEGRAFRHREPHPGSDWIDWEEGPSVLFSRARG